MNSYTFHHKTHPIPTPQDPPMAQEPEVDAHRHLIAAELTQGGRRRDGAGQQGPLHRQQKRVPLAGMQQIKAPAMCAADCRQCKCSGSTREGR
jgi:hypothetical protein